ncbi:MAG: protein kinase domain-containing protein [Pyrinomonadaceae bacterium]
MAKSKGLALSSTGQDKLMDAARWKQIDALMDAALEVPEELRANFIEVHAGDDDELKKQVLDLLSAHSSADEFLNDSAIQIAARALADEETEITAFGLVNKTIGTYRIERLLGAGGMGEVYLAFDEKLKRKVALKILPSQFVSDDERVKRFQMEARAISSLNHPGIVTIYDVGNFEGLHYIATEFVEGKTLRDLMSEEFTIGNIVLNSIRICDALAAAHKEGIVHRDIKPENIMIRDDGYPKILDFGLAKLTDSPHHGPQDLAATSKGMIMGTPAYMSPAQISGETVDHRTDLWGCCLILYEFLTGKHPFKGASRQETFQAILSKELLPCSAVNPQVPVELDRILLKQLQSDPAKGYQSALDLRNDLKRVRREIDSSSSWSGSSASSIENYRSIWFNRLLFAAVAMAIVFVGFSIYYFFFSNSQTPASEWASAKSVQLTFQAGSEAYPSLSPDGRSMVYVADTGGEDNIYLLRIGGANPVNLTPNSPKRDTMPAYSPDGEMIAFRSDREPAGIYVMGATGENPRRIADFGYSPSWSPNGKNLVVATGHQPVPSVRADSSLWIVDVETGEKKKLVDSYALQPAWSPKGDRIAYWTTGNSGTRTVETISINGGASEIFAETGNTNWNPVWSPDGEYLYFASDRSGNMAFWRAHIDLESGKAIGDPEMVPTPARFNRHLTFSADGKRIAYVQTNNRTNIKLVDFDPSAEKSIGDPKWVTRGDFEFADVEMSPDGTRFIARLIRKTQDDIVSINVDGTDMRDLTNDTYFDRYARLSPDGSRILFSSDRSGSYQLWMMNSDGTGLRQMTPNQSGLAATPAWDPNGKRFSFNNEQTVFIIGIEDSVNLETALKLPRTDNGGFFRVWSWSPDGNLLAGNFDSAHGSGMGFYSLKTGNYVRITDFPANPKWMPDSRRIVFIRNRRAAITDVHSKVVREILPEIKDEMRSIGVSIDGKKLFYTTLENESDIWLLDRAATP